MLILVRIAAKAAKLAKAAPAFRKEITEGGFTQ
jgi:hypothetical protein